MSRAVRITVAKLTSLPSNSWTDLTINGNGGKKKPKPKNALKLQVRFLKS